MLNGIILNLVLGYVVGLLSQMGASFNWTAVKADLHAKLKALIPWPYLEGVAEKLVDALLGVCAGVLQDGAVLKALMADVATKKWDEAVAALKQLILDNWKPVSEDGLALQSFLKGGELKWPEPKPAPAPLITKAGVVLAPDPAALTPDPKAS